MLLQAAHLVIGIGVGVITFHPATATALTFSPSASLLQDPGARAPV